MLSIAGLLLPLLALGYFWVQGQMSVGAKITGTLLVGATFALPAVFVGGPPDGLLQQPGFWLAARMAAGVVLIFWTKLSDIHI